MELLGQILFSLAMAVGFMWVMVEFSRHLDKEDDPRFRALRKRLGRQLTSLSPLHAGFTATPVADYAKYPAVYTCKSEEWIQAWKIGDWNTAKVTCAGKHPKIATWINGVKICEFDGETFSHPKYDKEKVAAALGREGSVAVQVHGGKGAWPVGAKCRWKNMRLRPL